MQLDLEYNLGDVVYLRIREENVRGLVTGLIVRRYDNCIACCYEVTWPTGSDIHYGYELSTCYVPHYTDWA